MYPVPGDAPRFFLLCFLQCTSVGIHALVGSIDSTAAAVSAPRVRGQKPLFARPTTLNPLSRDDNYTRLKPDVLL